VESGGGILAIQRNGAFKRGEGFLEPPAAPVDKAFGQVDPGIC
jgi:hypothetical protein